MQNSHVVLIIVMATHCLVCGSRMQQRTLQHCGLICAAGALSHEKSHAVNLIGAPEIRTATSSSPRNRSKYTRPSSPCRGGVWDRDYSLHSDIASHTAVQLHLVNHGNSKSGFTQHLLMLHSMWH